MVNGSFESDYAGWSVSGNQQIVPFGATHGTKAVRFNAGQTTPDGVLSQSVSTIAGHSYILSLDVGGYSPFSPKEQRMAVTVHGHQLLLAQTISHLAGGEISYTRRTYSFTADSSVTVLRLQDVSLTSDAVDLYLDNVTLTTGGSAVGGPIITSQPQNVTVQAGGNATFHVSATGSGLSYQWRFNGGSIAGATAGSYSISNVQAGHQGNYSVVIANGGGSVTSASAALTVTAASSSSGLVNGSFESDYAGWSVSGNQQIVPFGATQGAKAVRFNAGQTTPDGVLSQSIATTPGRIYTLRLDVGGYSPFSPKEQRMAVTVHGNQLLLAQTIAHLAGAEITYTRKTYTFTADSAVTVLRLQDVSLTSDAVDLYLDNVSVD